MMDCCHEEVESDSPIDLQKNWSEVKLQSVSCYIEDALDVPTQWGSHHSYNLKPASQMIQSVLINTIHQLLLMLKSAC